MAGTKSNVVAKSKKSNRGGHRPGAGRKPATKRSTTAKHRALARAVDDLDAKADSPFHSDLAFFLAMNCLGGGPAVAVAALGITQDDFSRRFGPAFLAWSAARGPMRR